jgi:hypothetical protein
MDCILPAADSGRTCTKRIDEYAIGFIFVKHIHRMYMLRENNCPTRGCKQPPRRIREGRLGPMFSKRTPNCDFRIPAKIHTTNKKLPSALSRTAELGWAEQPSVGRIKNFYK